MEYGLGPPLVGAHLVNGHSRRDYVAVENSSSISEKVLACSSVTVYKEYCYKQNK
jgi:hypothetical protein